MIALIASGGSLGLAAGLSPGPLMTLLMAETLRGGWPAGLRVSVAPLVTDSVLVTLALLLAAPLPAWGLSVISMVGGLILVSMGWGTIRSAGAPVREVAAGGAPTGNPLGRAIATNLLNAQAFLFWLTIGGPVLTEAFRTSGWKGPVIFMGAFFGVMITINLILAFGISRGRHLLAGPGYKWALRGAGAMLAVLGGMRLWAGLRAFM